MLSFQQDCISGNRSGEQNCQKRFFPPLPPSTNDVERFDRLLQGRQDFFYTFRQVEGGHNKLAGWRIGKYVKELANSDRRSIEAIPRVIESTALEMLEDLRMVVQSLIQQ